MKNILLIPLLFCLVASAQRDTLKLVTKNKTFTWTTEAGSIDSNGRFKSATFKSSTDSFRVEWEPKDTTLVCNRIPFCFAGNDTTITGSTAILSGKGFDTDGVIKYYKWTKVKGSPSKGSISTSTKATTGLIGLVPGVYTFQLMVTDDHNYTAVDKVILTVKL